MESFTRLFSKFKNSEYKDPFDFAVFGDQAAESSSASELQPAFSYPETDTTPSNSQPGQVWCQMFAPAARSNKIRTRSGSTSHGLPVKSQNKRGPSGAGNKKRNGSVQMNKHNAAEANKKTGKQSSSAAPKQIWQVKTKPEPSSTKSTSKDPKAKERAAAPSGAKEKAVPSKVNQKEKQKTEPSNNSSTLPTQTWRVKEKKQPPSKVSSKSSSKRWKRSSQQRSRNENYHVDHHIEWEDIDETEEPIGYLCCLCKNDLAFAPNPPEIELEVTNFPDTAILPCDHTFHLQCLEMAMLQENLKEPPCIICMSLTSQE